MAAYKKAQKLTWKDILIRYIWIVIGAAIYTFGLDVLLVPKSIIDGGVVGLALMAAELTGISFSIYLVLINLPFLYVGYKLIGRSFTIATLFGVVCISIMSLFMHNVTPPDIDPFLASIFGGVILGIGVGLIIRNGGSLDGVEIVAIILDKKSSFSVGEIVMICNLFILGAAGFVYSWNSAMYSLIAYFVAYKMMDMTITGLEESKGIMIITDSPDEIREVLMHRLGRGVTVLFGEGGYSKEPKKVLYSVVTRLEITKMKDIVYEQDENAFITITDVHDVFGGQFGKKTIH
ncbi:YitT family protein [Veillonella intestinalis]|uniref:YitT family protein n=1 Tax=Veillonella intestinalis TaxID=2941341 RepID=UPI00203E5E8F|nr:YitT family protein [Veillonella intestinalis]